MSQAPEAVPPAIEARALEKRFGAVRALRPLDLELAPGRTLAVLGPNGAGKSTLLRLLAGLARPSGGSLRVGAPVRSAAERRGRVGLIAHATFLYPALTGRENLSLAARLYGVANPARRVEELVHDFGLADFADRPAGGLSRGMAQRVSIARALVHQPEVLLLDEPFTGLDPTAAEQLADRLSQRLLAPSGPGGGRGATALLVTHDLARAARLADEVLVLVAGRGQRLAPEALATPQALEEAYGQCVRAAPLAQGRPRAGADPAAAGA